MSATPISRLPDSADLLVQVGATARRLAQSVILPQLRAFDSDQSARAWGEISSQLGANGLLDPPFDAADPSSPGLIAAILREIAATCPGVAAALWSHYSGCLPFWLSGQSINRTELTACSSAGLAPGVPHRSFGSTASIQAVDYSESGTTGSFSLLPLLTQDSTDGLLGLRACRFGDFGAENDRQEKSSILTLDISSARALARSTEAISLPWLAAVAASNAESAIREATDYARSRYQGCGLIIDHPVIRTMLGRMTMLNAATRALVDKAIESRDPVQAGLAKAFATQSAEQICSEAIQVLGGYGYMEDYGLEKRLRDAKTLCIIGRSNRNLVDRAGARLDEDHHGN
ncbi:MAG: acyl-CoA/acyl-ACP dehydrogenase [Nitrospirae bacterium]|nr:acyl-CoA/acyl-ACP dehydrogenase [Nitrospirota bacterium]